MSNTPQSKVAICIPSGDMVHMDAAGSWILLMLYCQSHGIRFSLCNPKASLIEVARNNAVAAARQIEATHLMFIDSDVMVPPDAIERLLQHEKPIVGATYCMRRIPYHLTHTNFDGTRTVQSEEPHEVKRLPSGCVLINMKVFEALKKPYYRCEWLQDGRCLSEDNAFCDSARAADFSVWLDPKLSAELRHIGQYPFRLADAVDPC